MFFKDFLFGISSFFEAHKLISRFKLWKYLIIPGVLSLCFIMCLIVIGTIFFSGFSAYISENWLPDFLSADLFRVITNIFLWILLVMIGLISYKHIILIIFSPILSRLSEQIEKLEYQQELTKVSFKEIISDIFRGAIINIRNLFFTILLISISLLFVVIPIIGAIISTILMFFIQAYYSGFGLADYTLERKRYSVKMSIQFAKDNRSLVIGVGSGFMLLLMIPIIGWFLAPAYGTVAATISVLKKVNQ